MSGISGSAPIVLFAYNRLPHLRATIEALRMNPEASTSLLYVYSDAPKNSDSEASVREVRSYLSHLTGFGGVDVVERSGNLGLARSIIDGVTHICDKYGRAIVLEDDIVVAPYFLKYMNDGLNLYHDDQRVVSIHGYQYPVGVSLPETFFLRGADCWGWATWKRGWDLFEPDGRQLLAQLENRKLSRQFDLDDAYPYTRMLRHQIEGKNNSWAIRWHASAFLNEKLTLYPGRSLVRNIGTDSSGTHCSTTDVYTSDVSEQPVQIRPIPVEEHNQARAIIAAFHKASRTSLPTRVLSRLLKIVKRRG